MTLDIEQLFDKATLLSQLELLEDKDATKYPDELSNAPIFTESARRYASSLPSNPLGQYGLLGGDRSKMSGATHGRGSRLSSSDPRLYQNVTAPTSVFICGVQGSGKSHTLSCMLENCLILSDANNLDEPLTGMVFHYDQFTSDGNGTPCEAAYLSSHSEATVRVLCPPTNISQIRRTYSKLPHVQVEELCFDEADLNTKRMLDLMATSSVQGGGMPLYLHVVTRILRQLRIIQQNSNSPFNYRAFKRQLEAEDSTPGQRCPLQQRLDTLESFMASDQVSAFSTGSKKKKAAVQARRGSDWTPRAGQLIIVDLSCPCVTPEAACALFNICLSLFLEQPSSIGRVIALDEAHKYMVDTAECETLTQALLTAIRLQRHQGVRIIISTQEPTISPKLLDLCSVTIVHRFTSPSWLRALRMHLAGATDLKAGAGFLDGSSVHDDFGTELFSQIVALRTGEALLFAPSAVVDIRKCPSKDCVVDASPDEVKTEGPVNLNDGTTGAIAKLLRLGPGHMRIRVRKRITQDGGRSVMAGASRSTGLD